MNDVIPAGSVWQSEARNSEVSSQICALEEAEIIDSITAFFD